MGLWYSRPVLFVADVARSSDFYVGKLGFREKWRYPEVAQVERDECEIIFSTDRPDQIGTGRLFIELTAEDFAALPEALASSDVPFTRSHWGYPVLIVADPDGNEIYFPDPEAPLATASVA